VVPSSFVATYWPKLRPLIRCGGLPRDIRGGVNGDAEGGGNAAGFSSSRTIPYSGSGTCCDSACSATTATISWPWWRETAADTSIGMQATHSTVTAPVRKAPHLWHLFLARSSTPQLYRSAAGIHEGRRARLRLFPGSHANSSGLRGCRRLLGPTPPDESPGYACITMHSFSCAETGTHLPR
jgi:hypothetical protein